jgi:hypothetical protein
MRSGPSSARDFVSRYHLSRHLIGIVPLPTRQAGHMAKRRVGVEFSPSMLEPVRPGAVFTPPKTVFGALGNIYVFAPDITPEPFIDIVLPSTFTPPKTVVEALGNV